jgi:hypothetical protein
VSVTPHCHTSAWVAGSIATIRFRWSWLVMKTPLGRTQC